MRAVLKKSLECIVCLALTGVFVLVWAIVYDQVYLR